MPFVKKNPHPDDPPPRTSKGVPRKRIAGLGAFDLKLKRKGLKKLETILSDLKKKGYLRPGADLSEACKELRPEVFEALVFAMMPGLAKASDQVAAAKILLAYSEGTPKTEHRVGEKRDLNIGDTKEFVKKLDRVDAELRKAPSGVDEGRQGEVEAAAERSSEQAPVGDGGYSDLGDGVGDSDSEGAGGDYTLPVSEEFLVSGEEAPLPDSVEGPSGGDNSEHGYRDVGFGEATSPEPDSFYFSETGYSESGP